MGVTTGVYKPRLRAAARGAIGAEGLSGGKENTGRGSELPPGSFLGAGLCKKRISKVRHIDRQVTVLDTNEPMLGIKSNPKLEPTCYSFQPK